MIVRRVLGPLLMRRLRSNGKIPAQQTGAWRGTRLISDGIRMERLYKEILKTLPIAAFELDRTCNIVFFNAEAARLLGYGEMELLNKTFMDLVPDGIRPGFVNVLDSLSAGKTVRDVELALLRKDGAINGVRLGAAPLTTGDGVTGFVLFANDTEEIRKIKDELGKVKSESEKTSEKLKNNIKDLEDFALMAVRREIKMKEIREMLNRIREDREYGKEFRH